MWFWSRFVVGHRGVGSGAGQASLAQRRRLAYRIGPCVCTCTPSVVHATDMDEPTGRPRSPGPQLGTSGRTVAALPAQSPGTARQHESLGSQPGTRGRNALAALPAPKPWQSLAPCKPWVATRHQRLERVSRASRFKPWLSLATFSLGPHPSTCGRKASGRFPPKALTHAGNRKRPIRGTSF